MQGLDIDDPLILEERILDLRYRSRRLESELQVLKDTIGFEAGNLKSKNKSKNMMHSKLALKIKGLELKMTDKVELLMKEKLDYELKIKTNLMASDKVHQEYYESQRERER